MVDLPHASEMNYQLRRVVRGYWHPMHGSEILWCDESGHTSQLAAQVDTAVSRWVESKGGLSFLPQSRLGE